MARRRAKTPAKAKKRDATVLMFDPPDELQQLFPDLDLSTFPVNVSPGAPIAEMANYVLEHIKQFQRKKKQKILPPPNAPPAASTSKEHQPGQRRRQKLVKTKKGQLVATTSSSAVAISPAVARPTEVEDQLEPIVITLHGGRRSLIAGVPMLTQFADELLSFYEKESRDASTVCKGEESKKIVTHLLHQDFPLCRSQLIVHLVDELSARYSAAAVVCFFVESKFPDFARKYFLHVEDEEWEKMTTLMAAPRRRKASGTNEMCKLSGANEKDPVAESRQRFEAILQELRSDYAEIFNDGNDKNNDENAASEEKRSEGGGTNQDIIVGPGVQRLRPDADQVPSRVKTFQCVVCFDDFPVTSAIRCHAECEFVDLVDPSKSRQYQSHSFCADCLRGQAGAATSDAPISAGGIGLRCMAEGCKNAILFADCRSFIPAKVRRVLNERIVEEVLATAGFLDLERCKKCNYAADADGLSPNVLRVFSCAKCSFEYCRLCGREWTHEHVGISCEELAKQEDAEQAMRRVEDKMSEAVIRKCPKCGMGFIKQDGCNKMQCRCGMTQCYLCRASKINYDHFCQHVRNPGQKKCSQKGCTKCLLWETPAKGDKQAINDVVREAREQGINVPPTPKK